MTLDQRHQLGANNPPDAIDDFDARLEAENADLFDRETDLVLETRKLPKEVTSEADVAKMTEHMLKRRALVRDLEKARVEAKQPYLERGRAVDRVFGSATGRIAEDADKLEKRSVPFLAAKARREREEAQAKAREAQEALERTRREQFEAQQREAAARRQRELDEQKLAEQEKERARVAKLQAEADASETGFTVVEDDFLDLPSADEQEAALRQSELDVQRAEDASVAAAEEARVAQLAADQAEQKASNVGSLGRIQGGGGSAKVRTVWEARIVSWPKLRESLGPLGALNEKWGNAMSNSVISDAVDRCCKFDPRPDVPGVEFQETVDIRTTASRKPA